MQIQGKHLQLLDIILNSIFIKFQGHIYENAGLSVYNIRGSQALLEEIDPDENTKEAETDEIESPTYVNVNMTHISLKMLWKYKLQNTANDTLVTEFEVCKNFICIQIRKQQRVLFNLNQLINNANICSQYFSFNAESAFRTSTEI